jgi:hypothetical protein
MLTPLLWARRASELAWDIVKRWLSLNADAGWGGSAGEESSECRAEVAQVCGSLANTVVGGLDLADLLRELMVRQSDDFEIHPGPAQRWISPTNG